MSNRQDDALLVVAYEVSDDQGDFLAYVPPPHLIRGNSHLVRLSDAQSAIASLQARLDAAEADAARYQHIRYFGFNWFGEVIRLAQLDREIDAVLAEKTK